jgi:tetratricopeptide (TPR) repeat protein
MKTVNSIRNGIIKAAFFGVLVLLSEGLGMAQEDPLVSGNLNLLLAKESVDRDTIVSALKKAVADFSSELETFPGSAEALTGRAEAKLMLGDYRGAIADCRKATEIERENVAACIIQGRAEAELGDYRSALREFDKAINLNPHHTGVNLTYFMRANVKSDSGNDAAAIIDYNLSLEIAPFAAAFYRRGISKWNLVDRKGACADWNKAKEMGLQEAEAMLDKHCKQPQIPEPFR